MALAFQGVEVIVITTINFSASYRYRIDTLDVLLSLSIRYSHVTHPIYFDNVINTLVSLHAGMLLSSPAMLNSS